ncbi:MAG TPA: hypothetical protein VFX19_06770 [Dehalococcoidia bacterium]|jgi:hypothetical protein|nr:hypothetical protein [Dehalococcoidia bacterium]
MIRNWDERDALAGIAIGTLNTCLLVGLLVFGLYLTSDLGDLLDDLSTAIGLAIFGLLWVVTCFCTYRAWQESGGSLSVDAPPPRFLRACLYWGCFNGIIFFNALLIAVFVVLVALALVDGGPQQAFFAAIFGLFACCLGTILSGMVGIVAGLVFGLFDMVLLDVARSLAGVRGQEGIHP